ncbi:2-oxoacid:acceptor oxidoreductase subunit alpha, partial [Candidatus Bathyarchaeota archaeon]|nr:2-oxoacid:acceptor oxidoreductase subunit alpha [Candidatus Bathyarchaeota archaeon]
PLQCHPYHKLGNKRKTRLNLGETLITNKISLLVGGEAGAGISRSGFLFAKTCLRGGLYVFGANDYQSLIRGGHNFYTVRACDETVYSQADTVDLLIALNKETILLHKDELVSGAAVIYDGDQITVTTEELGRDDIKLIPVPMRKIVKGLEGPTIMENTVALGAAIALLDYDPELMNNVLMDTFYPKIAEQNIEATKQGYDYIKEHYAADFGYQLKKTGSADKKRIFLTGNEAIGLGALNAGCKFYAAYPMTPATSILHFFAPLDREYNMIVIQTESEIAAINMVAGASFAGARSMTATSGGGFCLMTEGLGMIGMTETSPVIVLVQRPGPSTGLPTYTAQGDLRFAIHASQGEFPRVVIAPGDVEESYYLTLEAFNLAEKFQIPAIIISDKYLAESNGTAEPFDQNRIKIDRGNLITDDKYSGKEEYKRHMFTENGVSPRAMPGTRGAIVRTNADEHNELGYTTEDPVLSTKMADKRFKKLEDLTKELENHETVKLHGPKEADATIIGWGSTKGTILEAMKLLNKDGIKINYLQMVYLHPFPAGKVQEILRSAKKSIIVENNKTSQLSSLIREHLLRTVEHKLLKYDGRPFNPEALARSIREVL